MEKAFTKFLKATISLLTIQLVSLHIAKQTRRESIVANNRIEMYIPYVQIFYLARITIYFIFDYHSCIPEWLHNETSVIRCSSSNLWV